MQEVLVGVKRTLPGLGRQNGDVAEVFHHSRSGWGVPLMDSPALKFAFGNRSDKTLHAEV